MEKTPELLANNLARHRALKAKQKKKAQAKARARKSVSK